MNVANIGPDLRYQALIDCTSIIFGIIRHLRAVINFPKKALLKSIIFTFFGQFCSTKLLFNYWSFNGCFWLEISLKATWGNKINFLFVGLFVCFSFLHTLDLPVPRRVTQDSFWLLKELCHEIQPNQVIRKWSLN